MFKSNNHSDLVGFDETSKRSYSLKKASKGKLWSQIKWRNSINKWFAKH
jgi:hypothetical protein